MEMPLVIDLPRDLPNAPLSAPSAQPQPEADRLEVLLASPSPALRRRVAGLLQAGGHMVRQARSEAEAMAALVSDDGPTVALIDQALSGSAGELLGRARTMRPDRYIYAVLLVDGRGRAATVAAREAGADDCLAKPVEPRELDAYLASAQRIIQLATQLRSARDRFRAQATQDPLTGLSNRVAVQEILERELARADREGSPVAVIMVDLDHFKRINDTFGHQAGDEVLREAGNRMKGAVRVYDTVGRYGGEEFIVVLPGADAQVAARVAQRLRTQLSAGGVSTAEGQIPVTASLGVAACEAGAGVAPAELIRRADAALYQAKAEGRDRVVTATSRPRVVAPVEAEALASV
ncbi:MAG: diguanylate cyclase [Myxococcales bacterium]|nr:diguanylate cyclase [Myxococcales bacterium]